MSILLVGKELGERKKHYNRQPKTIKRAKELRQNMTPAEKILWEHLRAKRFHGLKFRRQQIIAGFIVDFYCHSLGLIIEVDGELHDRQKKQDLERESILESQGLQIIRFPNQQVIEDIETVLKAITSMTKLNIRLLI